MNREIVHVYDKRTSQKVNAKIEAVEGFAKPTNPPGAVEKPHEWSTSISMIPEFQMGELGITYDKYIDGKARGLFMNMLNLVMKIKFRCTGLASKDLANCHNLGTSYIKINSQ